MLMKSRLQTKAEKKENRKLTATAVVTGVILVVVINVLATAFDSTAVYFSALIMLVALVVTYLQYLAEFYIRDAHKSEEQNG